MITGHFNWLILSKIYKNVVLKQLSDYIQRTSICNSTQSSFRKRHSAQTILLKFEDDIQKALIKNEITMSVFIDYSKDFDTVRYETLKVILSYIGNRQLIWNPHINRYTLEFHRVVSLALFYLIYTFHNYHHSITIIQYADDASLYLSNFIRTIQSTISILKTDIKNLNKWSENSCLVFNDYKILSVLFT